MPTPSIQTLVNSAQAVLALQNMTTIRSTLAVALANANTGTPLNPGLTNQQLIDEARQVMTLPKSDIESIIVNQLMKFLNSPPAPGGVGANKQVIWNDAGVLTGDPNFTWDGPLSLLNITGSATITGNLTVDTNTLFVDSANNRVGIKQASPSHPFQIGTTDLILSATGNVGIGVTPSVWNSSAKAFEIGTAGNSVFSSSATFVEMTNNAYLDSVSNWARVNTGNAAARFRTSGSGFLWSQAAAGANPITWTQAMTLDASGRLLVGPTSANASGGVLQLSSGITFPATQVASSDANTLDDYEEGTFTPTVVGTTGAGTGTYTTQLGRYTKVGRVVTCDISLVWTAHTGTGALEIDGLPFSVLNTTGYAASAAIGYIDNIALTAGNIAIGVLWWFNTTKIRFNQTPTGGGAATGVPMDTAGQINLSITYIVA